MNKRNQVEKLLSDTLPDLFISTEPALYKEELKNTNYFNLKYVTSYSRNEASARGGGVSIHTKSELSAKEIDVTRFAKQNIFEVCCCKLKLKGTNRDCLMIGIYRPPNRDNFNEFCNLLTEMLLYCYDVK